MNDKEFIFPKWSITLHSKEPYYINHKFYSENTIIEHILMNDPTMTHYTDAAEVLSKFVKPK